jgi:DNA processing protein
VNVSSNTQYFQASFKDELEQNIYNTLLLENLTIDELSKKLQIDIPTLSFKLSIMEINKILKRTL